MIGNNSCGTHSIMGGKTVDNVEELDILLYDGTRMKVGGTSESDLQSILSEGGRRAEIYRGLTEIRDAYAPLVRERYPRIPRRVSGYNLDELLPENGFHVARALVGTEGTCVTVLAARLKLIDSPQQRWLVGLGYDDPYIAADDVPKILEFGPIALEGLEGKMVDTLAKKGDGGRRTDAERRRNSPGRVRLQRRGGSRKPRSPDDGRPSPQCGCTRYAAL